MRRLLLILGVTLLVACSSSGSAPDPGNEIPPDLVPATAAQATVTVTVAERTTTVGSDVVADVVPFLVRRVFDPVEPLASYGLDQPAAFVTFALPEGTTIILSIGGQDFDNTAYYVQRSGDPRIWLVLTESVAPLLSAAP